MGGMFLLLKKEGLGRDDTYDIFPARPLLFDIASLQLCNDMKTIQSYSTMCMDVGKVIALAA